MYIFEVNFNGFRFLIYCLEIVNDSVTWCSQTMGIMIASNHNTTIRNQIYSTSNPQTNTLMPINEMVSDRPILTCLKTFEYSQAPALKHHRAHTQCGPIALIGADLHHR